jgi:hypothetical protein
MVAGSGKGTIDLPINAVLPFVVRGRLFSCNFLGSLESVGGKCVGSTVNTLLRRM